MVRPGKPLLAGGLLLANLLLLACSAGGEGQSYPLPANEAYGRLYSTQLLRGVCQQDYGIQESSVRMDSRTADAISWIISSRGKDWVRLTADLEPADDGSTTVSVASQLVLKDDGFGGSAGDHSLVVAEALAMFREKVDSTLRSRPFEMRRVAAEVDAHLGYPTPPEDQKRVDRVEDVAPHMDRYAVDSRREDNPPRNAPGESANC